MCRLRRSSVNTVPGVPTGPAAASAPQQMPVVSASEAENLALDVAGSGEARDDKTGMPVAKDKFFIVKSLTVEDLELSVRNSVWATQSHNEEALNKAYEVRMKSNLALQR